MRRTASVWATIKPLQGFVIQPEVDYSALQRQFFFKVQYLFRVGSDSEPRAKGEPMQPAKR
jgi:hypothetical protein